jgi:hypothetical protein
MAPPPPFTIQRLEWQDEPLGSIPLPKAPLNLARSFGSGLARRESDPPGEFWAVGDRGPNLKVETLIERYGANHLAPHKKLAGAKVMPRPDVGPRLARLRIAGGRIELLEHFPITDGSGQPVSGLPMPASPHAAHEPALTLDGDRLPADESGLDTEGVVALEDGSFIFSEEFGPSLVRADGKGRVLGRYLPQGVETPGACYPVHPTLPAIAAARQLNRGFEAIAVSADQQFLFVAFQSPLAHPDEAAHKQARHVRLWRLEVATMSVEAQFSYRLDPPETFRRDMAKGHIERGDLKISELVALPDDRLLVLERASETTKIYRIALRREDALPPEHLDIRTRPTLEELSGKDAFPLPEVEKKLLFTSDDAPEMAPDLEGMVVLFPRELLLVNDSDFGVEGAETSFWKVTFADPGFA